MPELLLVVLAVEDGNPFDHLASEEVAKPADQPDRANGQRNNGVFCHRSALSRQIIGGDTRSYLCFLPSQDFLSLLQYARVCFC